MGFSAKQVQALRRQPDHRHIRTREAHGRELTYLEGWYAISEANRIFGFDGWSRETIESKCVLARENRGTFLAVYIARSGSPCMPMARPSFGKAMAPAKAAARHRARCTTSRSRPRKPMPPNGRWPPSESRSVSSSIGAAGQHHPRSPCPHAYCHWPAVPVPADARLGFHPDDTTPIPRPSRYYGRRQDLVTRDRAQGRRELEVRPSAGTSIIVPASPGLVPAQIDKSVLTIAEPKRLRDKAHLRFVASQPCLVCGRQPSDPHHLRFAQPRALVSKSATSSPFRSAAVIIGSCIRPAMKWPGGRSSRSMPLEIAKGLWEQTHPKSASTLSHEYAASPMTMRPKLTDEN